MYALSSVVPIRRTATRILWVPVKIVSQAFFIMVVTYSSSTLTNTPASYLGVPGFKSRSGGGHPAVYVIYVSLSPGE